MSTDLGSPAPGPGGAGLDVLRLGPRNPMRVVLLSVLLFEVVVFGLAIPVMIFNSGVSAGAAAGFGGGAALLAFAAAGMLRRPFGYPIGWLTQLVGLGLGFLTAAMFVVGIIFGGIWVISFILGRRLEPRT